MPQRTRPAMTATMPPGQNEPRLWRAFAVAAMLGLAGLGGIGPAQAHAPEPVKGGVLRFLVLHEPSTPVSIPCPAGPVRHVAPKMTEGFFASRKPRHTVAEIREGLRAAPGLGTRAARHRAARAMVERGDLPPEALPRHPHEFSGGQRQRPGIARALILSPRRALRGEPVSALDLSIQAEILNLPARMTADLGLSGPFIPHDLSVVRYFADRVRVMALGRIVETGGWRDILSPPLHPDTRALMAAAPTPGRRRQAAPLARALDNMRVIPAIAGPRTEERWDADVAAPGYRFTAKDGAPVAALVPEGHAAAFFSTDPSHPAEDRVPLTVGIDAALRMAEHAGARAAGRAAPRSVPPLAATAG